MSSGRLRQPKSVIDSSASNSIRLKIDAPPVLYADDLTLVLESKPDKREWRGQGNGEVLLCTSPFPCDFSKAAEVTYAHCKEWQTEAHTGGKTEQGNGEVLSIPLSRASSFLSQLSLSR